MKNPTLVRVGRRRTVKNRCIELDLPSRSVALINETLKQKERADTIPIDQYLCYDCDMAHAYAENTKMRRVKKQILHKWELYSTLYLNRWCDLNSTTALKFINIPWPIGPSNTLLFPAALQLDAVDTFYYMLWYIKYSRAHPENWKSFMESEIKRFSVDTFTQSYALALENRDAMLVAVSNVAYYWAQDHPIIILFCMKIVDKRRCVERLIA